MRADNIAIRPATRSRQDLTILDGFIRALAQEEGLPNVSASIAQLSEALFGHDALAQAVIAEADGQAAGFALYYPKYSTVTGRRGLHLEDIYVAPQHRDRHLGRFMLEHLQALTGVTGMIDLWVMNSNEAAIGFYQRVGARELDGVAVYRLNHPDMDPSHALTGLSSSEGI